MTRDRSAGRRSRFWSNFALTVVSILIGFAILMGAGEIWLRAEVGSGPRDRLADLAEFDEIRGWRLKPGHYELYNPNVPKRTDIRINTLGSRGGEVTNRPEPGRKRTTIIGDSFVFGAALDEPFTLAGQLQDLLGHGNEVVNLAVPGYGTGQEYEMLAEAMAKGFVPGQRIILFIFSNDVLDNLGLEARSGRVLSQKPAFGVDSSGQITVVRKARRPVGGNSSSTGLYQRLLFPEYLIERAKLLAVLYPGMTHWVASTLSLRPETGREPGLLVGWYKEGWKEKWSASANILEAFVRAVRREDRIVQFVYIPSPLQVNEAYVTIVAGITREKHAFDEFLSDRNRPQQLLLGLSKRIGVPFTDLTPMLTEAAKRNRVYIPGDGHLTVEGSAIAARAIARRIH